jgi:hypothetical protein
MHDLNGIIDKLPELLADYSAAKTYKKGHPFEAAIWAIAARIKRSDWNSVIYWLDQRHPNWRCDSALQTQEVA